MSRVTPQGAQPGGLAAGFDLFCGHRETKGVGEIDHCAGDLYIGRSAMRVPQQLLDAFVRAGEETVAKATAAARDARSASEAPP